MPVTICAAMRVGSPEPDSVTELIVKIAAPRAMRMLVLKPALFRRSSRSAPMSPPIAAASSSLWMSWMSDSGVLAAVVASVLLN